MSPRRQIICLIPSISFLTGCQSGELPQLWRGRRLYDTNHAFVYAGNDRAAAEASHLLDSVVADFEFVAGEPPPKGLLIITDSNDEPACDDPGTLYELVQLGHRLREQPATLIDQQSWESYEHHMRRRGFDAAGLMIMQPVLIDDAHLMSTFGFTKAQLAHCHWAVAVASKARIRSQLTESAKVVNSQILRGSDHAAAQQAGVRIFSWMKTKELQSKGLTYRDIILFQAFVQASPWLAERNRRLINAYVRWGKSGPRVLRGSWSAYARRKDLLVHSH